MKPPTKIALGLALSLAGGAGCATNPVPPAQRVSEQESVISGRGAYALLTFTNEAQARGELIAVSADTIWILPYDKPVILGYLRTSIRAVVLGIHDNDGQAIGVWTATGALSTLTHGFYLVLTLPIWLVITVPIAVAESHRGILELSALSPELNAYARFPQGLPPGVAAGGTGTHALIRSNPPAAPTPENLKRTIDKIDARPE